MQLSVRTVYGSTCGAKNHTDWKGDISRTVRKHKVITSFHNIPSISYLSTCLPVGTWLSAARKHIRPPKKAKAGLLKTYLKDNWAHIHSQAIYTTLWVYFCCLNGIMVLTSMCSLWEAGTQWELQSMSWTAVFHLPPLLKKKRNLKKNTSAENGRYKRRTENQSIYTLPAILCEQWHAVFSFSLQMLILISQPIFSGTQHYGM